MSDGTFEDCFFCGATGQVWHPTEIRLLLCPKCHGKSFIVTPEETPDVTPISHVVD